MAWLPRGLRRRPPFALVLIAVAAAIGGAFLLVGGGSGNAGGGSNAPPKLIGSGLEQTSLTPHAAATYTANNTIHLQNSAAPPVIETGSQKVGRSTVSVLVLHQEVQ